MEKVRFGIIGLGNQGSSYTKNLFMGGRIENGVLSAVCDNNPVKLDAIKEHVEGKNVAFFSDYKEMLDSGLVDAVLVEVPHEFHPEMVIECLNRDIHVISEKPAGVYTKQVKEMNAVADKSKALFGMMFNQRTNCLYRKMKEIIAAGELGQLQRVTWIITNWFRTKAYYDSGSWRATWTGEGGGVLINQCPHQLDLLQWLCGLPARVHAFAHEGKWHDVEVEDDVTAYLEFPNGATGVFITTTGDAPGTNRLEVTGTKGKLVCENDVLTFQKLAVDEREWCATCKEGFRKPDCETITVETDGENPQHIGVMNAFAAAIENGSPLVADGREGINGLMLSNAIHLSAWTGETVSLPIDEQKFLDLLNEKCKTSRHKEEVDTAVENQ